MSIENLVLKLNPCIRQKWPRTQYNLDVQSTALKMKLVNLAKKRESFNMIVMGPPGCGKTTFVETCLENMKPYDEFYKIRKIIRLNGLVCGSKQQSAINEIFKLMKIKDEMSSKRPNYDDRLDTVMEMLRTKLNESGAGKKARFYVFVLDNLEYFCEGTQLLLYNLFDACSSGQGCLGVIGITSRIDITEMFEKRVKSRFSHRIINLSGGRTFEDYVTMAGGLMCLEHTGPDVSKAIESWNEDVLVIMKSSETQKILKMLYETDKSIGRLSLFLYEVAVASENMSQIQENIVKAWNHFNVNSKVQQILDLSVFDLMLILAIRSVHSNPFQFENLWQHIHKLAAQFKLERSDMRNALQNLEAAELVVPVRTRGGGKLKKLDESGFYKANVSYSDMTTALKSYPQMPSSYLEHMND